MDESILGTEINMEWVLDPEGDIELVHGENNLAQGIYLRLTAYINSLDWCYPNYGSTLKDWLGKNQNPYTYETMIDEIKKRVLLDPRVNNCGVTIEDWGTDYIGVHIVAKIIDGETYEDYFIFSTLREKDENVNNPMYKNTHIKTRDAYYAKQGELIRVSCLVLDENYKRVPTGEVSISIGGYRVDIESNPSYLNQSGTNDPGGVSFTFRVPYFIQLGQHELIFKYKGIYGYNSCSISTKFHVVDKIPTSTRFIYQNQYDYYYANDVDIFTDPVVYVDDYNELPVRLGEVEYYLEDVGANKRLVINSILIFLDDELITQRVILKTRDIILDNTTKFMFSVNRMFHNKDIFRLENKKGEVIDILECVYEHGIYYLQSIYDDTSNENMSKLNSNIHLRVIE